MKPELLSPVGSPQALSAAIAAGADAVYLGAAAFGARTSAGFDDEALASAIHLAHLYGVRVYVTVNTLIKPQEIEDLRCLLARLEALRVDALIVQDLGLLAIIKAEFPHLCVHASTQMSVHNARGARLLRDLGVSRVVLARECSQEDIAAVAATGIETEVFVHGAMCVSVSGQCLFSSQIGGRSGNRGKCAQPCRLQYRYKDKEGAFLSMRDMNTLEGIPELLQAGANSFKIEGRLKRPEYVYLVTAAYRQALDAAIQGKAPVDLRGLQAGLSQVFSRGFTKGHAFRQQDAALISFDQVSHLGIRIGTITGVQRREGFFLASARLEAQLNDGDGLQIRGRQETDLIYAGPSVPRGNTAVLRTRQMPETGDTVWRLQDEAQLYQARAAAKLPVLQFDAALQVTPGEASCLEVRYKHSHAAVFGEASQSAQNQPLTVESAIKSIGKTGGTPFTLRHLTLEAGEPAFLGNGSLNALRREALLQLEDKIAADHSLPEAHPAFIRAAASPAEGVFNRRLLAILPDGASPADFSEAGVTQAITYINNYRTGFLEKRLASLGSRDVLLLPRQIGDKDLDHVLNLSRAGGFSLMADNIGQLQLGADIAAEGVPAWNEPSLCLLMALGIHSIVLSREVSRDEVDRLPRNLMELVVPVYGPATLMLLNHCPERQRLGLSDNKAGCMLCARRKGITGTALIDRLEARYPLLPTHFDDNCLISLYHHTPLSLGKQAPADTSWLLDLRLESPDDALRVAQYYAALMRGEQPASEPMPYTGRYLVGVE